MKKLLMLSLALALAIPCPGANLDYASMSDSELQAIVDSARTELFARKQRDENGSLIICDANGVQVALTGDMRLGSGGFLRMDATVANNSGKAVSVYADKGYLNGWESYCSLDASKLEPTKKIRTELVFLLEDAGLSALEEIEDITFNFHMSDPQTYDKFWESPEMQVFTDGEKVLSVQEVFNIG